MAVFYDGVVNLVIYLSFEVFIAQGTRNIYAVSADCLANWKWPARIHDTNLASMFSDDRADKHRKAQH